MIQVSNPFKHMRNRFYAYSLFENIINSLANPSGILMTSLFLYLALDESQIAILLSLGGLSTLLQVFSTLIYQRTNNKKRVILTFYFLRTLALFGVGLMPYFSLLSYFYPILLILMLLRFTFLHLLGGGMMEWMDSHVPEPIKGRYYGRRNAILNGAFIITTFFTGTILDRYQPSPSLYLTFFIAVVILYILEFIILIRIPIIKKEAKQQLSLSEVFKLPLRDQSYRRFIGFSILWVFALSLGRPLLNVYAVKYMNYSYSVIAIVSSITAFIKIFSGIYFGHLLDKKGVAYVITLCGIGFSLFSFTFIFLIPNNPIVFVFASIGLGIFMIAFNVAKLRLNLTLTDNEHMNTYLSANSFFVGIATFTSIYISGFVIDFFKQISLSIGRFTINSYQLLFFFSSTLHMIAVIYFIKMLKETTQINGEI